MKTFTLRYFDEIMPIFLVMSAIDWSKFILYT